MYVLYLEIIQHILILKYPKCINYTIVMYSNIDNDVNVHYDRHIINPVSCVMWLQDVFQQFAV